jgi:hypothetical protein
MKKFKKEKNVMERWCRVRSLLIASQKIPIVESLKLMEMLSLFIGHTFLVRVYNWTFHFEGNRLVKLNRRRKKKKAIE